MTVKHVPKHFGGKVQVLVVSLAQGLVQCAALEVLEKHDAACVLRRQRDAWASWV
jgi:hypothetical protein